MSKRNIIVILICLLASAGSLLSEETPEANLQRGLYFSDLYNWTAARPYIIKARQSFEASGDKERFICAAGSNQGWCGARCAARTVVQACAGTSSEPDTPI